MKMDDSYFVNGDRTKPKSYDQRRAEERAFAQHARAYPGHYRRSDGEK